MAPVQKAGWGPSGSALRLSCGCLCCPPVCVPSARASFPDGGPCLCLAEHQRLPAAVPRLQRGQSGRWVWVSSPAPGCPLSLTPEESESASRECVVPALLPLPPHTCSPAARARSPAQPPAACAQGSEPSLPPCPPVQACWHLVVAQRICTVPCAGQRWPPCGKVGPQLWWACVKSSLEVAAMRSGVSTVPARPWWQHPKSSVQVPRRTPSSCSPQVQSPQGDGGAGTAEAGQGTPSGPCGSPVQGRCAWGCWDVPPPSLPRPHLPITAFSVSRPGGGAAEVPAAGLVCPPGPRAQPVPGGRGCRGLRVGRHQFPPQRERLVAPVE